MLDRDVDRSGGEVQRAYGVPAQLSASRTGTSSWKYAGPNSISPRVPWPRRSTKQLGQLEVARVAGGAVQLDERQLDLRVTAHGVAAVGTELAVDVLGELEGHPREVAVDAGLERGGGGLEQVPEAVQLVPPLQVGVAGALPLSAEAVWR